MANPTAKRGSETVLRVEQCKMLTIQLLLFALGVLRAHAACVVGIDAQNERLPLLTALAAAVPVALLRSSGVLVRKGIGHHASGR